MKIKKRGNGADVGIDEIEPLGFECSLCLLEIVYSIKIMQRINLNKFK